MVVYIADDARAAAPIFSRVGFGGLAPGAPPTIPATERWLEVGFNPTAVDLGYH